MWMCATCPRTCSKYRRWTHPRHNSCNARRQNTRLDTWTQPYVKMRWGNNNCTPWDMQLRWLTGVRQPEVNHSFQVWFVTLLVIVITLLRRHIRRRQRRNWLSEPMRQWVSVWWQTAGKKNREIYSDVFFSLSRWGWSTFLFLSEQIRFVDTIFFIYMLFMKRLLIV